MRNTKLYPITLEEKIRALKKAIENEHSNPAIGSVNASALTLVLRDIEKANGLAVDVASDTTDVAGGKLSLNPETGEVEFAIPSSISQSLLWEDGDEVELSVLDGKLIISRAAGSE